VNTFFENIESGHGPNGNTKNEINFIITDKKQIIQEVIVLNHLSIGSDHRMVNDEIKFKKGKKYTHGS